MKKVLKAAALLLRPIMSFLLSAFFEKRYLSGRHFAPGLSGYLWAFRAIWTRNILRIASPCPWPVALTCHITKTENIIFHPDDLNNFQSPGTYFQSSKATITIGRGCYIGPNVGLITANHNQENLDMHCFGQPITLGEGCWIGMNAVVLPGVVLGPGTIVGAGAIVSKSFPQGHIVIAGVPARKISSQDN